MKTWMIYTTDSMFKGYVVAKSARKAVEKYISLYGGNTAGLLAQVQR